MIPFMCNTWNRQIHRDRSRFEVTKGWGRDSGELVPNGHSVSAWIDESFGNCVMLAQHDECD